MINIQMDTPIAIHAPQIKTEWTLCDTEDLAIIDMNLEKEMLEHLYKSIMDSFKMPQRFMMPAIGEQFPIFPGFDRGVKSQHSVIDDG